MQLIYTCKGAWAQVMWMRRVQYLRVLQESRLVVCTAAAAVQQRLCIFGPAPKMHDLMPCFMDTNQGSIYETANICICEELAPVCEWHPVNAGRRWIMTLWKNLMCGNVGIRETFAHQNSPSSATVMPRLPLSVSPTFDHSSELTRNKQSKWRFLNTLVY